VLVAELLRDLEVQDVGAEFDIVSDFKLHDFFLGLGVIGSIPHQHIYYTINRMFLHRRGSFFAIIMPYTR
jgi:hypothetical protein